MQENSTRCWQSNIHSNVVEEELWGDEIDQRESVCNTERTDSSSSLRKSVTQHQLLAIHHVDLPYPKSSCSRDGLQLMERVVCMCVGVRVEHSRHPQLILIRL